MRAIGQRMRPRKFDPQRFIEDCRSAASRPDAQAAIRELLAREIANSAERARGRWASQPRVDLNTLYHSPELHHSSKSSGRRSCSCLAARTQDVGAGRDL
jgi:hypothetical protein